MKFPRVLGIEAVGIVDAAPGRDLPMGQQVVFGTGVDGRLFVNRTGQAGTPLAPPFSNPLAMNTAYRVGGRARVDAPSPEQVDSPLARRPYDLRHACLSTWLNAEVPTTQVADWAGHSVNVLLKVYASCVVGQDGLLATHRRRPDALR